MIYVFFGPGGIRIPSNVFTSCGRNKHEKAPPPRYISTKRRMYQRCYHHHHHHLQHTVMRSYVYSVIIRFSEGETVRQTVVVVVGFVTNGGRENETMNRTGEENTQIKCLSNGFLLRSYNDSRQPCATTYIIYIYLNYDPCVAQATHRYRPHAVGTITTVVSTTVTYILSPEKSSEYNYYYWLT